MNVVWTKQARRDISAIHRFIAEDSEFYAVEVVEAILGAEIQIAAHPTAGGMVRERMRKDLRQVRRYSYRIIDRITRRRVDVLTVVHEKRQIELDE